MGFSFGFSSYVRVWQPPFLPYEPFTCKVLCPSQLAFFSSAGHLLYRSLHQHGASHAHLTSLLFSRVPAWFPPATPLPHALAAARTPTCSIASSLSPCQHCIYKLQTPSLPANQFSAPTDYSHVDYSRAAPYAHHHLQSIVPLAYCAPRSSSMHGYINLMNSHIKGGSPLRHDGIPLATIR